MRSLIFTMLFFIFSDSYSQKPVSCVEIVKEIELNNKLLGILSSYDLFYDAPWLKEVKCYESGDEIYVIAEFYLDDVLYSTKKYVYCKVPKGNWEYFSNRSQCCPIDIDGYGKRFHKYIADYKCNCE